MERELRDELKKLLRLYVQTKRSPLGDAVRVASDEVLFLERLQHELQLELPETELFRVRAFIHEYVPRLSAADVMILLSDLRPALQLLQQDGVDPRRLLRIRSDSDRAGKVFN